MTALRRDDGATGAAGEARDAIAVRRVGSAVRVACHAELDGPGVAHLRAVLLDLIDGQGNLTVDVVLPQVGTVDLRLLEVLVEAEDHLGRRDGRFSVTTKDGFWSPAVRPAAEHPGRVRRRASAT